ncbi:MAG: LysM peptidoglycan-binding domain-containing protein [Minicystis sp.]
MLLRRLRRPALVIAAGALLGAGHEALAFPHVVKKGETLASIAERTYGRVQMEQILVAANGLDAGGGIPIVAGMRLEVPAVGHHRVTAGETWAGLAAQLLGDERRGDVLAMANGSMPWLPPADGQELIVPYNLRYVVGANDSLLTIAYRFLGERDKAWMLDGYNHKKGDPVRRGDVVLVPLTELPLTAEGRAEAASAGALVRAEAEGKAREAQQRAEAELPQLAGDVRAGRWVDAVSRGNRMLGYGELTRPEVAAIQRALTEAYVALDAEGLAETACTAWRAADPSAALDPIELSPKILKACVSAAGMRPAPTVDDSPVVAPRLPAMPDPGSITGPRPGSTAHPFELGSPPRRARDGGR